MFIYEDLYFFDQFLIQGSSGDHLGTETRCFRSKESMIMQFLMFFFVDSGLVVFVFSWFSRREARGGDARPSAWACKHRAPPAVRVTFLIFLKFFPSKFS